MATILLADDDDATRDLVRRALEGHAVTLATDGADAWAKFSAAPGSFDLIVTDIEMPGLDGVTLAERALAASPRLKVLLMSGFSHSLDKGRTLAPGRLDVIPKPFTLETLRRAVSAAIA